MIFLENIKQKSEFLKKYMKRIKKRKFTISKKIILFRFIMHKNEHLNFKHYTNIMESLSF